MMPTSPMPPLKFRTAGFPRYGFKAGMSGGAFPRGVHVSRRLVCVRPAYPPPATRYLRAVPETFARMSTAVRAVMPLYPRGPRFGPGCVVLIHHRLCGPIRPSRGRSALSPLWLIRAALAVPAGLGGLRDVPCFRCSFLLGMPSSPTPGTSLMTSPNYATTDSGLRLFSTGSALPTVPPSASRGVSIFGASLVRVCYGLSSG